MAWLTKTQWRNLWRLIFAIPVRTTGDRWGYWWLYVLQLEDDCFYVGITRYRSVKTRYQQHQLGLGAKWTKLHRPIRIVLAYKLGHMQEKTAVLFETEQTLMWIEQRGVERVRGGKLVSVDPVRHRRQFERLSRQKIAL